MEGKLSPFWMLEGQIDVVKEIDCGNAVETHYVDEHGRVAVIWRVKTGVK